jgi:hypothetical protein
MASLTFADFKVFSTVTDINKGTYVTVAKGVLDFLKHQYGIYPEQETVVIDEFLTGRSLSITPSVFPIQSVYRIWQGTELLDNYSFYGRDILFTSLPTELRKPLTLELEVGWEPGKVPADLVLAIFSHIEAAYYAIDKHTDNILKTINTAGSTSYYINEALPKRVESVYRFYAGYKLVLA